MKRCVMMFVFLVFLLIIAALTERAENLAINDNLADNQHDIENQLVQGPGQ